MAKGEPSSSNIPDSQWRKWSGRLSALPFVSIALLIFLPSLFFSMYPVIGAFPKGVFSLLAAIAFALAVRSIRHYGRQWLFPIPLSIIGALTSGLYPSSLREPAFFSLGFRGSGFPYSWTFSTIPSIGPPPFGFRCHSTRLLSPPRLALLDLGYFVIDMTFFLTAILAAVAAIRTIKRSRIHPLER